MKSYYAYRVASFLFTPKELLDIVVSKLRFIM